MSNFDNYGLAAGYLVFGVTLVLLMLMNLCPSQVDTGAVTAFRCCCGGLLVVLGVILARSGADPIQALLFLVNAFLFLIVALITVSADSVVLPVICLTYLLLAAVVLLNQTPGRYLIAAMMAVVGFNALLRYLIAPGSDSISWGSGICCAIGALLSLYLGLAFADPEQRLPLR